MGPFYQDSPFDNERRRADDIALPVFTQAFMDFKELYERDRSDAQKWRKDTDTWKQDHDSSIQEIKQSITDAGKFEETIMSGARALKWIVALLALIGSIIVGAIKFLHWVSGNWRT